MTGTMKSIDYGSATSGNTVDMSAFILELQKISQSVARIAERPPADIRVPFPEIHNEYNVPSPQIDVHMPSVENKVVIEPTPVNVNVSAPGVTNDIRCDFPDLKKVVFSLYVLSGVSLVSSVGIIAAILLQ